MKRLLFSLVVMAWAATGHTQITVPQPSPGASFEQVVGLTNVAVAYSRPGMRGREIFGELVPYGEIWRTGANNNTTISFDTPVQIDGQALPAGKYALYTIPGEDQWEVIFYEATNNWGVPQEWDEDKVALKASASVEELEEEVETFTISLGNLSSDSADLEFLWEDTRVVLPVQVPTEEMAMASIEKALSGPSAADYFAAASYFHDEKKDLKKAYEWITKAVENGSPEAYWVLRRKALIEADMGMTREAIETAKQSLAAAKKAGNQDYVRINEASIAAWSQE